jgi:heme/copper-type cytochrome/quinol oxidase subunit 3
MGDLVPYRTPKSREDWTGYLGMVIFLASWAMMFAALFFAYGLVRARSDVWPPPDQPLLPIGLTALNTLVLALSSAALQYSLFAVRRGKVRAAGPAVLAGGVFGALFLGLQMWVWTGLYAAGLRPDTGPYASVFYGLTGFHGLHVGVGLVALSWMCWAAFRGRFTPAQHRGLRLWTMYWHFVGIVWAVMFVLVYLV